MDDDSVKTSEYGRDAIIVHLLYGGINSEKYRNEGKRNHQAEQNPWELEHDWKLNEGVELDCYG